MNWKWVGIATGILAGIAYLGFFSQPSGSDPSEKAVEVEWEQLYTLDYRTGEAPAELKAFHGKRVKIAGFVVPLSDNYSVLDEFLLVPDAQSCVHVPPPPPNLIVQSRLEKPLPASKVFNPAWITGILKIEMTESQYGSAGFQMVVEKLEEYVY